MSQVIAALFDLDGVIVDTERQYGTFWENVGLELHPELPDFAHRIKGRTLVHIFDLYFHNQPTVHAKLKADLARFEAQMSYDFIPGAIDFITDLRENEVKTAVVTSSNDEKMKLLYAAHPDFGSLFDTVITANQITNSKPDPECFLLGSLKLGAQPSKSYVFEDSLAGLMAGRASGAKVIGLTTTFSANEVEPLSDAVIEDFRDFTYLDMMETPFKPFARE